MTEDEARAWIAAHDVPRETLAAIERFIALLIDENRRQNLISASTIPSLWARHIVDSAQLLDHAPADGAWLDLGAGAGFPGLIVATLGARPVDLVESRAKRVQFLEAAAATLATPGVAVLAGRAETIPAKPYRVISARAFAPLERLFAIGQRFADKDTVWLLPKGRNAAAELAEARKTWQGDFALVPSVTDAESAILIARGVSLGRRR
jgi:16S rRNA (guanine527-N7)-methyltransferase